MNKVAWLASAMLIGSNFVVVTPSSAQVQLGVGPHGPSLRVGPDADRRYERRYIERRRYNDDFTTGSVRRCKTVTIREENDEGDMVTRRIRRCH